MFSKILQMFIILTLCFKNFYRCLYFWLHFFKNFTDVYIFGFIFSKSLQMFIFLALYFQKIYRCLYFWPCLFKKFTDVYIFGFFFKNFTDVYVFGLVFPRPSLLRIVVKQTAAKRGLHYMSGFK